MELSHEGFTFDIVRYVYDGVPPADEWLQPTLAREMAQAKEAGEDAKISGCMGPAEDHDKNLGEDRMLYPEPPPPPPRHSGGFPNIYFG